MDIAEISGKQVVLIQQSGSLMNISLRQLRAFIAVASTGSFTEAARRMNLTQSAVSMIVRQLEEEMALPLFDRHGRGVTPTAAAVELLPLASRMLEDLERITSGARDIRTLQRGALRLGATQMLACTCIPEVLQTFERQYPHISGRITDTTVDELVAMVKRGEVDIGIGPERRTDEDVHRDFLFEVPLRLICAQNHPLAARRQVAWDEITDIRWINYSTEFTQDLMSMLRRGNLLEASTRVLDVRHLTTAIALAGRGLGITVAPDYVTPFAAPLGATTIELINPVISRRFFVYSLAERSLMPAAETFLALLREQRRSPAP
jgi:DNA-binding transcriptional LysR family regulator